MPGLATDLLKLVKDVTAFHQPILDSFDPPKLITDPLVLSRIAYNRLPQNTQKPLLISDISPQPFIVWKGPFAYDQGQTAIGSSGTKKALFWFKCFHASATEADNWTDAIRSAVDVLTFPHQLIAYRITAALFVDLMASMDDQVRINGKEYPMQCSHIGYSFGHQRV